MARWSGPARPLWAIWISKAPCKRGWPFVRCCTPPLMLFMKRSSRCWIITKKWVMLLPRKWIKWWTPWAKSKRSWSTLAFIPWIVRLKSLPTAWVWVALAWTKMSANYQAVSAARCCWPSYCYKTPKFCFSTSPPTIWMWSTLNGLPNSCRIMSTPSFWFPMMCPSSIMYAM